MAQFMADLKNASNAVEGEAKSEGNTCSYCRVALTKHYDNVSGVMLSVISVAEP